ncbi:MAG: type II toxin-antitoxin system RelE/ParE family toxin [Firmicutes bacterium]|nr:type II toxin-antitoxin system RelE/ParE family toxin [Bacillota bacterium]
MEVKISPKMQKYIDGLDEPLKSRIKKSVAKLASEPPEGDIKRMSGLSGYRLRVGDYRILFSVENKTIYIHEVGPRGQIYK